VPDDGAGRPRDRRAADGASPDERSVPGRRRHLVHRRLGVRELGRQAGHGPADTGLWLLIRAGGHRGVSHPGDPPG
jgi:hypothetical protein